MVSVKSSKPYPVKLENRYLSYPGALAKLFSLLKFYHFVSFGFVIFILLHAEWIIWISYSWFLVGCTIFCYMPYITLSSFGLFTLICDFLAILNEICFLVDSKTYLLTSYGFLGSTNLYLISWLYDLFRAEFGLILNPCVIWNLFMYSLCPFSALKFSISAPSGISPYILTAGLRFLIFYDFSYISLSYALVPIILVLI